MPDLSWFNSTGMNRVIPDFGFAGKVKTIGFQKKRDFLGEFEPILIIQYTPFWEMCDALCLIRPLCRGSWLCMRKSFM
tara:strand:- start:269 stop:502 length:234 start_codon:yes stop_codon:yes gene_type:complete